MERRLKERLIGASVLVMLAVIFIPMVLDDSEQVETRITGSNIPPRPEDDFSSRIVPLPGGDFARPANAPASSAASAALPPAIEPQAEAKAETPAEAVSTVPPVASAAQDTAQPAPAAAARTDGARPDRVGLTAWVVQLGSFSSAENANGLNARLRAAGYASFVETLQQGAEPTYRVRVGPELLRSEAQVLRDRISAELELDGIVVGYP